MTFPRLRFSLRTLLIAAIFAGSVMLCWRVREAWDFRSIPLPSPDSTLIYLAVSYDGNYAVLGLRSPKGMREVNDEYVVADLRDGSEVYRKWDPLESTCRHASLSIL